MKFSLLSVGGAVADCLKKKKHCLHTISVRTGSRQDEGILLELQAVRFCKFFNIVAIRSQFLTLCYKVKWIEGLWKFL